MTRRVALLALLALTGVATAALAQASRTLEPPSGEFAVGRRSFIFIDSSRSEPAIADASHRREIPVTVWYPARAAQGTGRAPYMPNVEKYQGVVGDGTLAGWQSLESPVSIDAAAAAGPFPVLMFSHGWSGRAASYSEWLSDVASHGFVVVGVDHPFMGVVATSGPSATLARDDQFSSVAAAERFYAQDLAFVQKQLAVLNTVDPVLRGAILPGSLFASGHSSGFGSAASAFASLYTGVAGLLSFDSGVSGITHELGLRAPILLFRADDPSYTDIFVRGPRTNPHGTIYDSAVVRKLRAPLLDLQLRGTGHGAVLDSPGSGVGGNRAHALMSRYAIAFMRSVLAGRPGIDLRVEDSGSVTLRRISLDPAGPLDPRDEVLAVAQRLFDAMRTRDSAAVRAQFEPGARLIGMRRRANGDSVVSVRTVSDFIDQMMRDSRPWIERAWSPEVKVDRTLATIWTEYDFYAGPTFGSCGIDSVQLVRTPAGWRILSLADTAMGSGCPPRPAPKAP